MPKHPRDSKVALITGSGRRRVGNVIATSLAEEGYRIAIHYNRSENEARETVAQMAAAGVDAAAFQCDVADDEGVNRMFDAVIQRFGRLDVLVTTASLWRPRPLEDVTADEVRRNFEVNTLGTFLCARRAGLIMVGQEHGGVIITFGDWAIHRPYRDYAAYFTSKGAIPTLTRALAVELALRNPRVRVNCIHPGPVMFSEGMSEEERWKTIQSTLLKQADCPESIARTVLFFIENEFVTGVCLPVDAGRSIYAGE